MCRLNLKLSSISSILLIILCPLFVNTEQVVNTFCETGQLDSAVRVRSGRIFIFYGSYLTEINENLSVSDIEPKLIKDVFQYKIPYVNASFTTSGDNNPIKGQTFLISKNRIIEFNDTRNKTERHMINTWKLMKPIGEINLVINQIDDSMSVFLYINSTFNNTVANALKQFNVFIFDNSEQPQEVTIPAFISAQALIESPIIHQALILKAVVPTSDNKYLVFYSPIDVKKDGKYCKIEKLSDGCPEFVLSTTICYPHGKPTTIATIATTRPTIRPTITQTFSTSESESWTPPPPTNLPENSFLSLVVFFALLLLILLIGVCGLVAFIMLAKRKQEKDTLYSKTDQSTDQSMVLET